MRKYIFPLALIIVIIFMSMIISSYDHFKHNSETYYAIDSGSTVFSKVMEEGDVIHFFFDPKVLRGTSSHLLLSGPEGEILQWDKARGYGAKNRGEYIVKYDGVYEMSIVFDNPDVHRIDAEVEVNWNFR